MTELIGQTTNYRLSSSVEFNELSHIIHKGLYDIPIGGKLNQWLWLIGHTNSFTVGGETREKERGGREEGNNAPEPY